MTNDNHDANNNDTDDWENVDGNNGIILFGGFSASKTQQHLNDIWILNTDTDKWSTPNFSVKKSSQNESYTDCSDCLWLQGPKRQDPPPPRGFHSAILGLTQSDRICQGDFCSHQV